MPGQLENMSLNILWTTINTSIEKVPDKGWKNALIKRLKVASSWGRQVKEDHDLSTLFGEFKIFSRDKEKNQTRICPKMNDTKELEGGSNMVSTKKNNTQQTTKNLATRTMGMILL